MPYAIMMFVRTRLAYGPMLVFLLAAITNPSGLRAQGRFEGMIVRNIRFLPPEQPLDASELHELLPLKMNEPLHVTTVRDSIGKLFATGSYADIQVQAEPYRDGVAITFVTTNSWFIGGVSISGRLSGPPNAGQLESVADLNLGQPYSEGAVQRAMENQQRLLESNGLFLGHIHPVFDWDTGRNYQQVNIRFEVDSGPRARFTTPVLLGDLKMDQERILRATKFRRWLIHTWKPMTQTRVRQALEGVRSLYSKDDRLEAKVALDSMKYDREANRAIPTLRIDAGPRIQIQTVGTNISQKKLREYVPVFEEHAVDADLLAEGARNLRDYLQSQGYFEAQVQFKEQRVVNDRASIDYLIATGKRHRLVEIGISGNHYFPTDAIRERMFLRRASFLQFPHGRFSGNLLTRDEEAIRNLYESNGFRDVKITHREEDDYGGKIGDLAIFIKIEEGPQYFINDLKIEGIEHLDESAIRNRLSSVPDQPFSDFNVAVDRDTILARYFENGFPDATFEWTFSPAGEANRVDLRFTIREGKQQFVRQVVVSGNRITKTKLIDRNLKLNPGDPLSPIAITETQRRLYDLGVFSRVDAAIQNPDGEGDHKYVLFNLDEARRYSLATGFGAEFGRIGGCQTCLDDPAGTTGFAPRVSIDIARNNLWGVAHTISLRTRASTLDQRALLNYAWPRFLGDDNLTVSFTGLYEASRDIRTFSYKREEVSAQLTQRLTKATSLLYRFAYRRVSVSDLKVTPFLVPQLSQPVRVGIASINIVQDRRDDPVEPHKGVYNTLDLGLADRVFGSQVNFLRFLGRNASYYPIGKRFVLARSVLFGNIYGFGFLPGENAAEGIPLPERFFGGGTSLRAFPENQAGPRDPSTGFPLGGNVLFSNQTELRFPLIGENVGLVLFHDMGNVYSSISNFSFRVHQRDTEDFDYMVHAVGVGIRYRTPVGPLRLDLGYSINPPRFFGFNGTTQDLINAGPVPCSPPPGIPNQCSVQRVSHFQYFFSIGQTF